MHSVPRGGSLGPEVQPKHRRHTPAVARERTHEGRVNSPRNTVVLQGGIQKGVECQFLQNERWHFLGDTRAQQVCCASCGENCRLVRPLHYSRGFYC